MKILFLIMVNVSLSFTSDVLIHSKTGLMWQDNAAVQYVQKNWQGALDFCEKLHLAGHDDWRLPSIKELENVIELSKIREKSKDGFKHVAVPTYYWSSTPHDSSQDFAWIMNFTRGYAYNNYKTYERYVRCVRGEKILSTKESK